jgi:biotin carboxyl carrier protein
VKRFEIVVNDNAYLVEVTKTGRESAHVIVNGTPYEIGLTDLTAAKVPEMMAAGDSLPAGVPPAAATERKPEAKVETVGGITTVKAPLPGLIIEIKVSLGEKVNVGDALLVIETMKMENNIISTVAGTVKEILVSKGDNVAEGVPLIAIAA